MSGCFISDSLDLGAGQRAGDDIPKGGRWGCDAYGYPRQTVGYLGCLVIQGPGTYKLADVDKGILGKACDSIR